MKTVRSGTLILFLLVSSWSAAAGAQMMGGPMTGRDATIADDHTAREEAEGRAIWEKFQAREAGCDKFTNADFERLGEYFMGTMMGNAHTAMNAMMEQMMGEGGEEQVHVVMGKRLSGCDTSAAFPAAGRGFIPMMQMMWGGWPAPRSGDSGWIPMMGNFDGMMGSGWGGGFAWVFWITTILIWVLLGLGITALWRWIKRQG